MLLEEFEHDSDYKPDQVWKQEQLQEHRLVDRLVLALSNFYKTFGDRGSHHAKLSFLLLELAEKRKFVLHPESVVRMLELSILVSLQKLQDGGEPVTARLVLQTSNGLIEKIFSRVTDSADNLKKEPLTGVHGVKVPAFKNIPEEKLESVVDLEYEQFKRMSFAFQVPPTRKGSENISSGPGSFSGGSDLQPKPEYATKTTVLSSMLAKIDSRKQSENLQADEVDTAKPIPLDQVTSVNSYLNACALYLASCLNRCQKENDAPEILEVGLLSVLDLLLQHLSFNLSPESLVVYLLKACFMKHAVQSLLDKGNNCSKKAANLLGTILKSYRSFVWIEAYSLINNIVVPMIVSQNTEFTLRSTLLGFVSQTLSQNDLLIELYCAFDCNSGYSNLSAKIIGSFSRIFSPS